MASSRGSTPLMAKKHVCMIVLMRVPMPAAPPRHGVPVNHKKAQFLLNDRLLHLPWHVVPDFLGTERRIQQKGCARFRSCQHVNAVKELKLMESHKICRID